MTVSDYVRCVGAVAYDERGRLLLVQRGHEPQRGYWTLPGGRVEPGEDDHTALRRELAEETSLTVTVGARCGELHRDPYLIVDYFCTVDGGTPRAGDDAAALRFVTRAELDALAEDGALTTDLAPLLRAWGALPGS